MTISNETYAYFTVCDSFDPNDITQRVGVEPTESWKKGDRYGKKNVEYRFSRWSLRSRLEDTVPLEEHIKDVLSQLEQNTKAFLDLSEEFGGCMQLVGIFNEDYPGLHFDSGIVEGLAKYKLSVDFDFYYCWEDNNEDDCKANK